MLAAVVVTGVGVFLAGHRLAEGMCAKHLARPTDDLDWLRLEFRLSEGELARVRQLHDGYLPVCRGYCERIDARKRELQEALASGHSFRVPEDIPFPETKAYVQDIIEAWAIYRRAYGDELAAPA